MTPPEPTPPVGADAHYRALESLYAAAPINRLFESVLEIPESFTYLPLTVSGVMIALFSIERTLHLLVERRSQAGAEALAQAHAVLPSAE